MSKQLWKNDELNEKEREIQDLDCIIYLLNADIKIANDYLESLRLKRASREARKING